MIASRCASACPGINSEISDSIICQPHSNASSSGSSSLGSPCLARQNIFCRYITLAIYHFSTLTVLLLVKRLTSDFPLDFLQGLALGTDLPF